VRWVYRSGDGGPPDPYAGGKRPEHWLWLDITVGERTIPMINPARGDQVVPDIDHVVPSNSSASYHGKRLRDALRRLGG
jgi:hypothetical protein